MKILISPAKTLNETAPKSIVQYSTAPFLKESERLIKILKKYSEKKLQKLMDISPDLSKLNHDRYQKWTAPEELNENTFQAGLMFQGEVYRGLKFDELNEVQTDYAQENLRILSGLYGILKPLDLIFPYRLEMGTKLKVSPKINSLYAFWQDKISKNLKSEMAKGEMIINLASQEYFKAIDTKLFKNQVINIHFKEFKNGKYTVVAVFAKHARGEMAKYCCEKKINDPQELKEYEIDNYRLTEKLSDEFNWVFTR